MRKTALFMSVAALAPAAYAPNIVTAQTQGDGSTPSVEIDPQDQAAINATAPAEVTVFMGRIVRRIPSIKNHLTRDYFNTTPSGMKISLQPDFIPTNMRLDIDRHKGTYGKTKHFSDELLEVTYSKSNPKKIGKLTLDLKNVTFKTNADGRVLKDKNGEFLIDDEDFTRYNFELGDTDDWRVGVFTPFQKDVGFWAGTAKVVKDVSKDMKPHLDHILR